VNIVILNWQRPLWEGDREVVKRSGRGEPIWVVIYMSMEATLGIPLYSYLSQTSKNAMSFLLSLMFSTKLENKRANRFCLEALGRGAKGGEGDPNNVYTCE
jgi:hypothetical protein